uniref:Retrovirus-related Pol polyprotein from transposon TNT 1-94 n=2 Tax=Cajanus cajan TaxID=3821 RepID=A0A151SYM1_CAJCA|nr:Retrovirus-related Pol polyprotein from transposon TNT 1-94 [Cajanus cajan]
MRALLKEQRVWGPLVSVSAKKENIAKSEEKPTSVKNEDLAEQEEKAHSLILLSLSDEVLYEVADQETASGLWLKLEKLYMTKSICNKLLLKRRLFGLHMKEDTPLQDHLDELNSILMELRDINVKIEDEDAAMILLASLPPSYESFVNSLSVGKECITMEEVKSSLHSRELRFKASANSEGVNGAGLLAFNSTTNGKKKKEQGKKKTKVNPRDICNYCKEPGHWKKDCPKKRNQKSVVVAAQEDSSFENELVLSIVDNHQHFVEQWVLDSGCSYHMCPNRSWFLTYEKKFGGDVFMGNDMACKTISIGTIQIKMHDGVIRTLTEVRHVPDLKKNLISVGVLDTKGFKCNVEGGVMEINKGSTIVIRGIKKGNLYMLQGSTNLISESISVADKHTLDLTRLWHMRLGHMSERGMMVLSKQKLLRDHTVKELKFCEHCVLGKHHRSKFPKAQHTTKSTLDYVHSNCWGPSRVPSLGGGRYFLSIIDDYSRMTWIFIMKHKNQAFKYFKEWKILVENQTGKRIKRLRTDNSLEFCSAEFNDYCKKEGIVRQYTVRNTPQQNGVAKRMNRTLLEKARCLLSNDSLTKSFWAEAVNTA